MCNTIWCITNMMHDQYDAWLCTMRGHLIQYDACIKSNILRKPVRPISNQSHGTGKSHLCGLSAKRSLCIILSYASYYPCMILGMVHGDLFTLRPIWWVVNMMHDDLFTLAPIWCMDQFNVWLNIMCDPTWCIVTFLHLTHGSQHP